MKITKEMIRTEIIESDLNWKVENYIVPLQELSSYLATIFFDYAVTFKTTFSMLKEIDRSNIISKPKFGIAVYNFYKWSLNKRKEFDKDLSYNIGISEIGVNFTISIEEIINSIDEFVYQIREWNLETNISTWKKNIKDITPYIDKMFKEVTFFKHTLYSIFLKDESFEYPESIKIDTIKNINILSNTIDDYIGTLNTVYSDLVTIQDILQSTVDFNSPMNFKRYVEERGLNLDEIKNAIYNGPITADEDDDF